MEKNWVSQRREDILQQREGVPENDSKRATMIKRGEMGTRRRRGEKFSALIGGTGPGGLSSDVSVREKKEIANPCRMSSVGEKGTAGGEETKISSKRKPRIALEKKKEQARKTPSRKVDSP